MDWGANRGLSWAVLMPGSEPCEGRVGFRARVSTMVWGLDGLQVSKLGGQVLGFSELNNFGLKARVRGP